jgi:glycosidase
MNQMKQTIGQDFTIEETETGIVFGNGRLSLTFSKTNGSWTGLQDHRTHQLWCEGSEDTPSLSFRIGGTAERLPGVLRNSRLPFLSGARVIGTGKKYQKHRCTLSETRATFAIMSKEGPWSITELFTLETSSSRVEREVEIAFHGNETILLRDVNLTVPEISIDTPDQWTIEAPGYPVRPRFPVSAMPLGEWGGTAPSLDSKVGTAQQDADAPASKPGLVGLHHSGPQKSLLCWAFSADAPSILSVDRTKTGVQITQHTIAARWMEPGSTARIGKQFLFSETETWPDSLGRFQTQWADVGIASPADKPEWSRGVAIYEVHIGKAIFPEGRSYEPYPQMEDLIIDLDRIRWLGFNTLLIMPHQPFPGYTVHDFFDAKTTYGGDKDLKQLVAKAHSLGLRVLLDVVTHGCVDKDIVRWQQQLLGERFRQVLEEWQQRASDRSPYLEQHPEWFMRDEQGEIAKIYTAAFDHANPEWQGFIINVLAHYVEAYDVDGYRIDAPTWNFMPNWDRSLAHPAVFSIYGAARLFANARRELKKIKPDVVLYTEPPGPLFRRDFDLNYNYDEHWTFPSLLPVISPRGFAGERTFDGGRITARELMIWLEDRRRVLPPRSVTVHHLDSHDTFWWGRLAQFRHEAFGREAANALFALCAFLDGGVMNYVGGEVGAEDFYRRIIQLKRELPELRDGVCDYVEGRTDRDDVLALLWTDDHGVAIPLISFAASAVSCTVRFPAPAASVCEARNALSDKPEVLKIASGDSSQLEVSLSLESYQVAVLVIRPSPPSSLAQSE